MEKKILDEKLATLKGNPSPQDENNTQIFEYFSKNSIVGYHPKSGIVDKEIAPEVPNKKIKICPTMRLELCMEEFINKFKESWISKHKMESNGVEVITNPFKLCVFNDFINNTEIVDSIRQDFNEVEWTRRNMDLYEFFQSKDVKHIHLEYIKGFYEFLKCTVMPWVSNLSGYDLVEISATCSCYTITDYLLVHDDQREDRMVAFIYYLTDNDNWNTSKGGSLDLFSKDEQGLPSKIVRRIFPRNNQLVIFPVTNDSYHQVAEVLDGETSRLTINGWFHTKTAPIFNIPHFEYPANGLFGKKDLKPEQTDILLESWIDEDYISNTDGTLDDIQKHLEENSEISLTNFFKVEALEEVIKCLNIVEEDKWTRPAPPNRNWYDVLSIDSLPFSLERFLSLFHSEQFFAYLKSITDLDLKSFKFELQKWTPGCYCLLSDHNWNSTHELDVIVYLIPEDEYNVIGGRIQYVNAEEEIQEALITIEPSKNTLNLVYRDTARFTKYYSKLSKSEKFYLLICSYTE